jgi:hypothetical protein
VWICGVPPQIASLHSSSPDGFAKWTVEAGGATPSAARGMRALPIFNCITPAEAARLVAREPPEGGTSNMNGTLAEPLVWIARRRTLAIVIAVAAQVLLIFWFSEKSPLRPRAANARPVVQLAALARSELLSLTDPALFALARPDGFSGRAWLTISGHDYRPAEAAAPQQWLALAPGSLGAAFREFVRTNAAGEPVLRNWQAPAITLPSADAEPPMAAQSMLRIEGALAVRGLLKPPQLPAWPNADILAPSEVLVLVDAHGNPVSSVLLAGSGLKAADARAVELARALSFGADRDALAKRPNDPTAGVVSGRVIFQWHTLAPAVNGSVNPR